MVSTRLAVFSCPSDTGYPYLDAAAWAVYVKPEGRSGIQDQLRFLREIATTRYCNYWCRRAPAHPADVRREQRCQVADVRDGTSNTIAMAETTYDVYNGRG